ncbi:MAG TPA: hypothetical protein VJX66_26695 [Amycolatopsis sp.]|nr:hypothetical protein [Amycolatopsis sp.]
MHRKTAGLLVAVLSLLGLSILPAAADAQTGPPGCGVLRYHALFGQRIAATCPPGKGFGYHVIAHCSDGHAVWQDSGPVVVYGFGPSVAECSGTLLHPAWVTGYDIFED